MRLPTRVLASLLPFASLAVGTAVARDTAPDAAAVAAYGERLLAEAVPDANGPGLAVLVARGDTVLFRGARGRASIELGVALTPDHVFRIGSVTKQFAAATLLKLVDEGKARLDDPLSKYLPDYPNGASITLHQLLNHTSGIRSYTDLPGYMDERVRLDRDTAGMIAVFKDEKVDFAPGEKWAYNNSGYVLVGAVIEKISGKSWHAQMEAALLEPLGLAHTRLGADRTVIAGAADGYSLGANGDVMRADPLSMTQPHAAGALVSTVDDLLRWNLALHGGKLLSKASYRRMTTPEGVAAEAPGRYGYGLQRQTVRGRAALAHSGGINGFLSNLIYLPESGLTAVALRNADGAAPSPVDRRLLAFALGDPYPEAVPVDVPAATLEALAGVYRLDAQTTRTLRVIDGKLVSQRSGGSAFTLIPLGSDRFGFPNSLARIEFVREAGGAPTGLRFFADGEDGEAWTRTDEKPATRTTIGLPPAARAELVGDYAGDTLAFKVFLDDAGELRVQVPGQPAFALVAETPRRLFIAEVDATIEFAPASGRAQSARLRQGPADLVLERKP